MTRAARTAPRTTLRVALVVLTLLGGAACTAILGIEQLPLRGAADARAPDAGGDAAAKDAEVDARAKCGPRTTGCLCGSIPHDFCADFDDVTLATDGWRFESLEPSPPVFAQGGATSALSDAGAPPSPPNALLTVATGKKLEASIAFLVHGLSHDKLYPGGSGFLGLRYAFKARLQIATFGQGAGPLAGTGSGSFAAMFLGESPQRGVLLLVSDPTAAAPGIYVGSSTDLIVTQAAGVYKPVTTALPKPDEWVSYEILVAPRDRATAEGYAECSTEADSLVVAARANGGAGGVAGAACLALPPELSTAADWGTGLTVATGGLTFGDGNLRVFDDDITVDFLH